MPTSFMTQVMEEGVFFLLPREPENIHFSICLAEGLQELGVPVHCNIDAYRRSADSEWLFRKSTVSPENAACVALDVSDAVDAQPFEWQNAASERISAFRNRTVLICISDGAATLPFPTDIPVFVGHENAAINVPGWRIPWAFGLSHEMLKKIEAARTPAPRKRALVRNFRPSANQSVRQALDLAFVQRMSKTFEIDRAIEENDTSRFLDEHYRQLATALGCLAYGGMFLEDFSRNKAMRERHPQFSFHVKKDSVEIARWDSWRFWESLASGCVTIALDFDFYQFRLPVMPANNRHYLGLRFDDLEQLEKILNGPASNLSEIAISGQAWALENYSPKAVATRFLHTLAEIRR